MRLKFRCVEYQVWSILTENLINSKVGITAEKHYG